MPAVVTAGIVVAVLLSSVVEPALQLGEPLLQIADAAVAFLLASPAEREPRRHPQEAHARERCAASAWPPSRRPANGPRAAGAPRPDGPWSPRSPSSFQLLFRPLDVLLQRLLGELGLGWRSSGAIRGPPRSRRQRGVPNTPATISIAAQRGRTRSSASAPAIPRKPITNRPQHGRGAEDPDGLGPRADHLADLLLRELDLLAHQRRDVRGDRPEQRTRAPGAVGRWRASTGGAAPLEDGPAYRRRPAPPSSPN